MYRDWIIPNIVKEITKGKEFLANLSPEEVRWVVDQLAVNAANAKIKEAVLNFDAPMPTEEERQEIIREFKKNFAKNGKSIIKILKDEFKGVEVRMGINVANKQKDLVNLSDKILSIFQFVFQNPQGFQET